jgi:hypothetical protein
MLAQSDARAFHENHPTSRCSRPPSAAAERQALGKAVRESARGRY